MASSKTAMTVLLVLGGIFLFGFTLIPSGRPVSADGTAAAPAGYTFDRTISRPVLENYLSRAITMQDFLTDEDDFEDNLRMLKNIHAKFIGRSICQWAGEDQLLHNFEVEKKLIPRAHAADPEMILEACIFEIVTSRVDEVPVPSWVFTAFGLPAEKRNFRYADMLFPDGRFKDHWKKDASVPDVSREETKLWFYFLAASYIDMGIEAIHFGQVELMDQNDPNLDNYEQVFRMIRAYAAKHARRHLVLCDAHVPGGGLIRNGKLLLDFHAFPLRIKETPDSPQQAILQAGFSDGIYNRSKGGLTYSGWKCDHLPYLVEFDNYGVSKHPGEAHASKGGFLWIWGYDEITWFAQQPKKYRSYWLHYAWSWVRKTDPAGFLEMPGSRVMTSPLDHKRWYHANPPGNAIPDGYGDAETIRAIWAGDPVR
ncbi:hypothetical protein [Compostibacter hankyongensis]|uniref:Uncharacterized protein n=1 Tax=Compostibacter hankyongensis TaxID=1007089 RepID=A0ABP8FJP0_9BACT